MIFVYLILFVILLSQILYMFDVSVTYDVAEQPPIEVEDEYVGGSVVPEFPIPPEDYEAEETVIVQETTAIESLLTVEGIRFIFTSFVSNFASFSVVAVVLVAMIGVGVAEEAGLMAALIRKLVKVCPRRAADLHHHPDRRAFQRRHGRRLPDPDPARRRGLPERREASARRVGRGLCGRERSLLGQHPDCAAGRPADGGDQRGDPAGRPRSDDRHHRQPVLLHRLHASSWRWS